MSETPLPAEFRLNVTVGEGKYTVQQDETGRLSALRYGEPWRDCCGDGLIYMLAAEVQELRDNSIPWDRIDVVLRHVMRAIYDPGSYTPRGHNYDETIGSWQERAKMIALQRAREELKTEPPKS